jgi:uncharacterized cupredoxin-like copper-binding protein
MRYLTTGAVALAAAALLGAGCGGSSHRALQIVSVTERDFAIRAPRLVPAGEVRFVVTNKGPVDHELLLVRATREPLPRRSDGFTIAEGSLAHRLVAALEPAEPGVREVAVHLSPGRYVLFCNMEGHAASGMITSFRVR